MHPMVSEELIGVAQHGQCAPLPHVGRGRGWGRRLRTNGPKTTTLTLPHKGGRNRPGKRPGRESEVGGHAC